MTDMPKPAAKEKTDPRTEAAAVRDYLELLNAPKPRGRRTIEFMQKRLAEISDTDQSTLTAMQRIELIQERIDTERDLTAATDTAALEAAEKRFIDVGADWASRKGISYAALREIGVPAAVLRDAGISR